MSKLDRIVDLTITRKATGIKTANFSTILILSANAYTVFETGTNYKVYTSANAVLSDFADTSGEYLMAQAIFGQDVSVNEIWIGAVDEAGDETLVDAFDKVLNDSGQFYGVIPLEFPATFTKTEVTDLAGRCKTNRKFLFVGSSDTDIKGTTEDSDTATIAYELNNGGYNKTALIYNGAYRQTGADVNEDLGYIDGAFASKMLAKTVGSYTTVYKTLDFAKPDELTDTNIKNIEYKNTNYYISIAGRDVTAGGRVTDGNTPENGEFIDVEIGIDWMYARIQEAVALLLFNNEKIPYTDEGVTQLQSAVSEVLDEAVDNDFLVDYDVDAEPADEQPDSDKSDRYYKGLSFTANLAGAIHKTQIRGSVVL